jgi:hypothetical protein
MDDYGQVSQISATTERIYITNATSSSSPAATAADAADRGARKLTMRANSYDSCSTTNCHPNMFTETTSAGSEWYKADLIARPAPQKWTVTAVHLMGPSGYAERMKSLKVSVCTSASTCTSTCGTTATDITAADGGKWFQVHCSIANAYGIKIEAAATALALSGLKVFGHATSAAFTAPGDVVALDIASDGTLYAVNTLGDIYKKLAAGAWTQDATLGGEVKHLTIAPGDVFWKIGMHD